MVARVNYDQPEPQSEVARSRSKSWSVPLDQLDFDNEPAPLRHRPRAASRSYNALPPQPLRASRPTNIFASIHPVVLAAGVAVAALLAYLLLSVLVSWVAVRLDDLQYGSPRTMQLDALVGHNEEGGSPTHLIAINLNRQISVIEIPGGDIGKARVITGPYLFGAEENLTPAKLAVRDLNGDSKPDLLLTVKNEQVVYLNDGQNFRAITASERSSLQGGSSQ